MRVGFLAPGAPFDVRTYSGVPFFTFNELKKRDIELIHIDGGDLFLSKSTHWLNRNARRLTGKSLFSSEPSFRLRAAARKVDKQVEEANLDVLICLNVDFLISFLRCKTPIIHNSDATFAAIVNYYDAYKTLWAPSRRRAMALTQRALDRPAYFSFPSVWAQQSAIQDYGVPVEKTTVIPYGANLIEPPKPRLTTEEHVEGACQLLFIGGNWERKGGPLAYQSFLALLEKGVDAYMTVVGVTPDLEHPRLIKIGFLNKQKPDDLELYTRLWNEASFLFMPSQQETFGAIYSEAAANSVPVIACDTGGIGSCVIDGETGLLLERDAKPEEFAEAIKNVWDRPESYCSLSKAARTRYETTLNWSSWADQMLTLAYKVTGK